MTPLNDDTAVLNAIPAAADAPAAGPAKASHKRWLSRVTPVLCALGILVGGFIGGLEAEKHAGTSTTATNPAGSFGGGFPGGGQPAGAATAAATAARTTGTVKSIDGTTIYLRTADGKVVTVKLDGKTTVSTATTGKVADVKPGQSVIVQGATGADGTVAATSVTTQTK